jgi:hypothetical protein
MALCSERLSKFAVLHGVSLLQMAAFLMSAPER